MFPASVECAVAVFARAPVAGAAKTRLIPRLGAEGAANLHAALVRHTLATVKASGLAPVTLWCAPSRHHPFFETCVDEFGVRLRDQQDGDLGERMHAAFVERGVGSLLLVGTDCPSITVAHLRSCADALSAGVDAALLPAEDGGYGLIGLNRPVAEVFLNMQWSTDSVMDETRQRLERLGLRWRELGTIWDVDRPEDIDRLAASQLLRELPPVA